jgi:hypothetical protein
MRKYKAQVMIYADNELKKEKIELMLQRVLCSQVWRLEGRVLTIDEVDEK